MVLGIRLADEIANGKGKDKKRCSSCEEWKSLPDFSPGGKSYQVLKAACIANVRFAMLNGIESGIPH